MTTDFKMLYGVARALDDVMLNEEAVGDISSYSIEVIPDDSRIEIVQMAKVSVDHIKCKVILKAGNQV
jgi:hypothetical protein